MMDNKQRQMNKFEDFLFGRNETHNWRRILPQTPRNALVADLDCRPGTRWLTMPLNVSHLMPSLSNTVVTRHFKRDYE
jgi:hypothetical protein